MCYSCKNSIFSNFRSNLLKIWHILRKILPKSSSSNLFVAHIFVKVTFICGIYRIVMYIFSVQAYRLMLLNNCVSLARKESLLICFLNILSPQPTDPGFQKAHERINSTCLGINSHVACQKNS